MLHSLPVILVIALYFDNKIGIEILLLPFALILLMLNGIWIGIVLGIMCARFRDLLPIITNFVQVAFFFTPVMLSLIHI